MGNLAKLLGLVRDAQAERERTVIELNRLRAERRALDTAPLPRADVIAQLERYIDAQQNRFDENLQAAVHVVVGQPLLDLAQLPYGVPVLQQLHGNRNLDAGLVAAALGDLLKARCRDVINRMDWPQPGPSAAARPALRARLDDQISAATLVLAEFDEQLAAAREPIAEVTHGR
jgi:hypothetical protein